MTLKLRKVSFTNKQAFMYTYVYSRYVAIFLYTYYKLQFVLSNPSQVCECLKIVRFHFSALLSPMSPAAGDKFFPPHHCKWSVSPHMDEEFRRDLHKPGFLFFSLHLANANAPHTVVVQSVATAVAVVLLGTYLIQLLLSLLSLPLLLLPLLLPRSRLFLSWYWCLLFIDYCRCCCCCC